MEILTSVGSGGLGKLLGNGGSIARTAASAIVLLDKAGEAVGVVSAVASSIQDPNAVNVTTAAAGVFYARSKVSCPANAS